MTECDADVRANLTRVLININTAIYDSRLVARTKPLHGGLFGASGFSLASLCSTHHGLDEVTYYVACTDRRFVISAGSTKAEALSLARMVLQKLGAGAVAEMAARFQADIEAQLAVQRAQRAEEIKAMSSRKREAPQIPRRRKAVFEASAGKCHYCGAALTLDGRWHIEHKMPRALLGGSEQANLVAACVPCNMKKRDMTDLEFKASLGAA